MGFTETEGLPWAEIDDANDFHYAQTVVYPALKPMTGRSNRCIRTPVPDMYRWCGRGCLK